jgi:hypothetical protein
MSLSAIDYVAIRSADIPRRQRFALDGSVKPKSWILTSITEGLLALLLPIGDVMREADEKKQAPSFAKVKEVALQPKLLRSIHDSIVYTLTTGSLINLMEGMCHPLAVPATVAGRYFLHGEAISATLGACI